MYILVNKSFSDSENFTFSTFFKPLIFSLAFPSFYKLLYYRKQSIVNMKMFARVILYLQLEKLVENQMDPKMETSEFFYSTGYVFVWFCHFVFVLFTNSVKYAFRS